MVDRKADHTAQPDTHAPGPAPFGGADPARPGIGAFFGALPGTGPAIAAFISYAVEKRSAREPARFGNGAIEGVAAPEAANNAADQTAFIPTLMLGIPGSAAMAIMIAALIIHGIAPGPNIMTQEPRAILGPGHELLDRQPNAADHGGAAGRHLDPHPDDPVPLALSGDLAVRLHRRLFGQQLDRSTSGWCVLLGGFGYLFRLVDLPAAPLLLGFVLGPMMEEHFRRALMIVARGLLDFFPEAYQRNGVRPDLVHCRMVAVRCVA